MKANAVIVTTSASDSVFFKNTPARRSFSSVQDAGFCTCRFFDKPVRQCGDPTEPLEKVQADAFEGENRTGLTTDFTQDFTRGDAVAVRYEWFPVDSWLKLFGNQANNRQATDHTIAASHKPADTCCGFRDCGKACDIAGCAKIFIQGQIDQLLGLMDFREFKGRIWVRHKGLCLEFYEFRKKLSADTWARRFGPVICLFLASGTRTGGLALRTSGRPGWPA